MRVALTGPVDLELLQPLLSTPVRSRGYTFPMTAHLAIELVHKGHDVCVVALDPTAEAAYALSGPALHVRVVPMRPRARDRALDAFRSERRQLTQALRDAGTEVVHAQWTYEFALAARQSGLPTVVTVHDWAPAVLAHHRDIYRSVRLGMQVRAVYTAQHLTAVSPYIQRRVESWYRKPCELVANGLAEDYYMAPRDEAAPSHELRFGSLVAGDDARKNLRRLIEAFALVRVRAPHARLSVAGGGCDPAGKLHQWARCRGVDDGVDFLGRVPVGEVPRYLAGLDVFVHPALEESFGMVLIEAMAAGTPVIGGKSSGAVPWVLDGGRAGVLADVRRRDNLADAMLSLADPVVRRAWSSRARARAADFRMSLIADRYVEVYRRALA